MPQLMGHKPSAHAGPRGASAQGAGRRARPRPATGATADYAEQRTDRHRLAELEPGLEVLKAPVVHADLAPVADLAAAPHHRPAPRVEIEIARSNRRLVAQPGA